MSCSGPTLWRMDAPNSPAKASDRRVRADQWVNSPQGSWTKWFNKSGWVTWAMGQYPWPIDPWLICIQKLVKQFLLFWKD